MTDADLASLAARWREKAVRARLGWYYSPRAAALIECADDLAALRGMTTTNVTRTGELAVDPAPQPATTDSKG